jgi:hypothetical protein
MKMKGLKRKPVEPGPLPPFVVRTIGSVNQWIKRAADLLQRKTNGLSATKLKWILILFCVLYTSGSIYIILKSLNSKKKSFTVSSIHVLPLVKDSVQKKAITQSELIKIHHFKLYLDSLKNERNGKALRDSLLHNRPHLLDTLDYLENLYEQNKN